MKILFAMASPEFLRFYDEAVRLLADRGHEVTLAVQRQREVRPVRLEEFAAERGRIRVAGFVPPRDDRWQPIARRLRGLGDFVRYLHPRFAAAPALRARMKRKGLHRAFHALDLIPTLGEGGTRAAHALVRACERAIPSSPVVEAFIREHGPDLVLVTPVVEAASEQADLVKSARALGVPVAACIASWDNLTNKGLIHGAPDAVLVWNAHQKGEAVQLHGVPERRVLAVGAPVVDAWLGRHAGRSAAEIATAFDLDAGRPYLLYVCSSRHIVADREPAFVRSWIAALRDAPSPALRALQVVVRPHPDNTADWYDGALAGITGVRVWPQECLRQDEHGEQLYFDVVSRSRAIVGINTTAMLEGALVGRPVFTVVAPEFARTQGSLPHFENLAGAGFVSLAATMDAHVAQLALVCEQPDTCGGGPNPAALAFVRSGAGPATTTFVDTLERLAAQPR